MSLDIIPFKNVLTEINNYEVLLYEIVFIRILLSRSNTGVMGSNPTQSMDVCV
jgi:hypothetical protein